MIIAMLAMVELCVRVKNQSEIIQSKQHSVRGRSLYIPELLSSFLYFFPLCMLSV